MHKNGLSDREVLIFWGFFFGKIRRLHYFTLMIPVYLFIFWPCSGLLGRTLWNFNVYPRSSILQSLHHSKDVPLDLRTHHLSKLIMINASGFRKRMISSRDGLTMLNWNNFILMWSPDICWMHLLKDIKTYYLEGRGKQSDTYEGVVMMHSL